MSILIIDADVISPYMSGMEMSFGMMLLTGTTVLFALAAAFSIVWGMRIKKQLADPLRDITRCLEVASTGDMTRLPKASTCSAVQPLAQAAEKLIKVLSRSENLVYHLATLVESTGEAIISVTMDGTILSWNKGAQRIYGYSPEEMKGRWISVLSPNESRSEILYRLQRVRQGEKVNPFEAVHAARNGRPVRAFIRISAIMDATRKVIGASFCAQDLTETELLRTTAANQKRAI